MLSVKIKPFLKPLTSFLPGINFLLVYRSAWLRNDGLAGITVAAYLIPQCMAYGELAGVQPVAGLWGILPSLLIYTLFVLIYNLSVVIYNLFVLIYILFVVIYNLFVLICTLSVFIYTLIVLIYILSVLIFNLLVLI